MQHEMQHETQCEDDTKLQPGISAGPCYFIFCVSIFVHSNPSGD